MRKPGSVYQPFGRPLPHAKTGFRNSNPNKMGLLTGLIVFVAACLMGATLYWRAEQALKEEVRGNLIRIAQVAALLVNGDQQKQLITYKQNAKQVYSKAIHPLRQLLDRCRDVQSVSTFVLRQDRVYFVLTLASFGNIKRGSKDNKLLIMQPYKGAGPGLVHALRKRTSTAETQPRPEARGTFLNGYAPFYDSKGNFVGVVGVALPAGQHQTRLNNLRHAAWLGIAVALLLSVLTGLWASASLKRSLEQKAKAHPVEQTQESEESEKQPRTVVKTDSEVTGDASIILFAFDRKGTFTLCEGKGLTVFGLEPGQIAGRSAFELDFDFPVIPKDVERALEGESFLATGQIGEVWFEVAYTPVLDKHGKAAGAIGMATDITARKRAEEKLIQRLKVEQTLASTALRLGQPGDFDELMNLTLAEIGQLLGASRAYLFLMRDEGAKMDNTHEWCAEGVQPGIKLRGISTERFPWWMAKLRAGEIIHLTDMSQLPPEATAERKFLEARDFHSLLLLPVYAGTELAGFIGFDNALAASMWQEEDPILLRTIAGMIGDILQRQQMEQALISAHEQIQSLTSANKQKEEALASAHERIQSLTSAKENLEKDRHSVNERLRATEATNKQLEETLEATNRQLEETRATVKQLQESLESANKQLEALTTSKKQLENDLASANEQVTALTSSNKQLEDTLAEANKQLEVLTSSNKQLEDALTSAKEQLEVLTSSNKQLENDLASANEQVEILTSTNKQLEEASTAANEQLEAALSASKQLEESLASAKEQLKALTAENKQLKESLASANRQLETFTSANGQLEEVFAATNQQLETVLSEKGQLEEALASANEQLARLASSNRQLEEALASLNEQLEVLAASNKQLEDTLTLANKQIEGLTLENRQLEDALAAAHEQSSLPNPELEFSQRQELVEFNLSEPPQVGAYLRLEEEGAEALKNSSDEETEEPLEGLLNWGYLHHIAGGNRDFEREVLYQFLDTLQRMINELRAAIQARDHATITHITHSLSVSGRGAGAQAFVEAAHALEKAAEQGNLENAGMLYAEVEHQFRLLKRFVYKNYGSRAA